MTVPFPRTKILATLGPASQSLEVIRELVRAGMSVARLNFSHGQYQDHARIVANLRAIAQERDTPVTILQDLQGPKIRIDQLPAGQVTLFPGMLVTLVPADAYQGRPTAYRSTTLAWLRKPQSAPGCCSMTVCWSCALRISSGQACAAGWSKAAS